MAISKMSKIIIAGHLSEFDRFVDDLQHRSIFHPAELPQPRDSGGEPHSTSDVVLPTGSRDRHQLEEICAFLEPYRPKKTSFLQMLFKPRVCISSVQYRTITKNFNLHHFLASANKVKNRIDVLNRERESLMQENLELEPWKNVAVSLMDIQSMARAHAVVGRLSKEKIQEVFDLETVEGEVLGWHGKKAMVLLAFHSEGRADMMNFLRHKGLEEMPVWTTDVSPRDQYRHNLKRILEIDRESKQLKTNAAELVKAFDSLQILLAHYDNLERKNALFDYWMSTRNAFVITGWVRADHVEQLASIFAQYRTIQYEKIAPGPNDSPPVSLQNHKALAPFELITRLYGAPAYGSFDPSPAVSLFFVLSFSLCLTDAGYGLILCILALIGLGKRRAGRDILWILFWVGFFTLFVGLLTGGIFGDLFRSDNPYVRLPALNSLRDEMLWFDTLKEPMVFFRLVLLLGLIQVASGLAIGLAENVRDGRTTDGLLDKGTWLVLLGSLLLALFSSEMCVTLSLVTSGKPPLNSTLTRPALILAAVMAVIVVCFSARDEKNLFFRFFVGFLKLSVLSGIFSYLGDILSYIRLMALGMVTAGIGMAINTIAFMMVDIPVVGVLLTVVVLTGGHLFNLAINLLGGFVHTLRLQYVEFFTKFFVGGGKAFKPLSYGHKYISIVA